MSKQYYFYIVYSLVLVKIFLYSKYIQLSDIGISGQREFTHLLSSMTENTTKMEVISEHNNFSS